MHALLDWLCLRLPVPACARADYMRSAIRMAALSHAGTLFVMTHDSIGLGEDGPTHQPIEHLASFRAMPNILMMRPGDGNETAGAYQVSPPFWGCANPGRDEVAVCAICIIPCILFWRVPLAASASSRNLCAWPT